MLAGTNALAYFASLFLKKKSLKRLFFGGPIKKTFSVPQTVMNSKLECKTFAS
jgi:hypothetical protein